MKLSHVLGQLEPVVGLTSLIAAPESIGTAARGIPNLGAARDHLTRARSAQAACKSDAAYWGYVGQIAYWRTVVNLLLAAEITGPGDLPDVPLPERGGVVMDMASDLENFGVRVARAAGAEVSS